MSGWVYVVTNKSIRDLVRVGYTTRRDLTQRLREFNQTGLPYPYEKAYALWVEEPSLIEQRVHQALAAHKENKEWFRCSVERARETIKKIAGPEAEAETDRLEAQSRAKRAAKASVVEHKHVGHRLTPVDWGRLRARRPSGPQTHASQPLGRRPAQADEGDQEPARKRGQPQIQRDHRTWQAGEDLISKPERKTSEEIEAVIQRADAETTRIIAEGKAKTDRIIAEVAEDKAALDRAWAKARAREERRRRRATIPWDFWGPVIFFLLCGLFGSC